MVKLKVWSVLCVLLAGALTFSCSNEIPEGKPVMRQGRTVLSYLVANNNLNTSLEAYVVWMAFIYVVVNLLTDIVYRIADPQIGWKEGRRR